MQARLSWLDESEKRSFVEEALGILERIGVELPGSAALPVLADLGAEVDEASGLVRLPPELVMRAVESCPRRVLMAGVSPEFDVVLDEGEPTRFCSSGCAAFVLDHETGVRRPSTLRDLQAATTLLDETSEVDVLWTTITASDVPPEHRELAVCYVALAEARKHVTLVDSPSHAEPLLRIMELLSGDAEAFRARPRFSTLLTVASPLRIDGALLDFHARIAERGAPIEVFTVPMAGATSPVTVAGTIVQGLAEFLAAATALQALAPGARLIMGVSGATMDMHTAGVSYASPEAALMNVACIELAHHLGMPTAVPGLSTDAKHVGAQAGYEKALKGLCTAGVGADVLSGGVGMIDSASTFFLPQVVIDAEVIDMIRRVLGSVATSRDEMMISMIERVGIGGDYLREKDTTRRLRAGEHFTPRISSRQAYDQWSAEGRDEQTRATDRMQELFAAREERGRPLQGDVLKELAAICGIGSDQARILQHW